MFVSKKDIEELKTLLIKRNEQISEQISKAYSDFWNSSASILKDIEQLKEAMKALGAISSEVAEAEPKVNVDLEPDKEPLKLMRKPAVTVTRAMAGQAKLMHRMGVSFEHIAELLNISRQSVYRHVAHIYAKKSRMATTLNPEYQAALEKLGYVFRGV